METKTAILMILICGSMLPLMIFLTFVRLIRSEPVRISLKMWAFIILQYAVGGLLVVTVLFAGKHKSREVINELMYLGKEQTEIESNRLRCELLSQPKYQEPLRLAQYEGKVFSQNGEDGIIAEIFRRIGTTNRYFVEFGSSDGMESNTRCLLQQGWSGFWMDGNPRAIARANRRFAAEIEAKRLTANACFITAENIEQLFSSQDVPKELDLLSIDIDRNDYYVWKAIEAYKPRVVVIEYNGNYPPGIEWVVEYRADAWYDGTSNYGVSLSALETLGKVKGYSLVGCNVAGVNAFFVRNDLLHDKFSAPFTAKNHYEPPRYWMTWGGHRDSH